MKSIESKFSNHTQIGVAMIAVLWLVAAMSIIVTGIVATVKDEIKTTGEQKQVFINSAVADGAILMAMSTLFSQNKEELMRIEHVPVQFSGAMRDVLVQPLNGLIDINNASVALFADLFRYVGKLNVAKAQELAQSTVERRQLKNANGVIQGFDANEDLLQVPGMTYDLYVMVSDLITADLKDGSGRVNPFAAPFGVLLTLTGGDAVRANHTISRREADPSAVDTTNFKQEFIEMASSRSMRIQVPVSLLDNNLLVRSWTVHWSADERTGLPWSVRARQQMIQRSVFQIEQRHSTQTARQI